MDTYSFYNTREADFYDKYKSQVGKLPSFVCDYFNEQENRLKPATLLQYSYDLENFLLYFSSENPRFAGHVLTDFSLDDMKRLSSDDIENAVKWYEQSGTGGRRSSYTVNRFITSLSSLFSFYIKRGRLTYNPVIETKRRETADKKAVKPERLDKERYISAVINGTGLSDAQKRYHESWWYRDYTIVQILLHTGIRVSELVGLDRADISFKEHQLRIIRKNNKEEYVKMDDEVEKILQKYLFDRNDMKLTDDEDALFISRKQGRMSIRAVERMIKKYQDTELSSYENGVSPRYLRAAFAADIYDKTGDIYLASKSMGHKSVSTTAKYVDERK